MFAKLVTAVAIFGAVSYVLSPSGNGAIVTWASDGDIPHIGLGTWLSDEDKVSIPLLLAVSNEHGPN